MQVQYCTYSELQALAPGSQVVDGTLVVMPFTNAEMANQAFADAELTLLALQAGVYAYDSNSVLVEVDWDKDHAGVDAKDRALFAKRKAEQFDGKVTQAILLDLLA